MGEGGVPPQRSSVIALMAVDEFTTLPGEAGPAGRLRKHLLNLLNGSGLR